MCSWFCRHLKKKRPKQLPKSTDDASKEPFTCASNRRFILLHQSFCLRIFWFVVKSDWSWSRSWSSPSYQAWGDIACLFDGILVWNLQKRFLGFFKPHWCVGEKGSASPLCHWAWLWVVNSLSGQVRSAVVLQTKESNKTMSIVHGKMEVMAQCYIIAFSRTLGSQKGFGFQTHWCVGESSCWPSATELNLGVPMSC